MVKINADEYYSSHGLDGKVNNIEKMLLIDDNYKKNIEKKYVFFKKLLTRFFYR